MKNIKSSLFYILLLFAQPVYSENIDTFLIHTVKKYSTIINQWHVENWSLSELYRRADISELIKIINNDIGNNIISINPQALTILQLIKTEKNSDPVVLQALDQIIAYFSSKTPTQSFPENKLLTEIHKTVFQISQPQYDGNPESIVDITGRIETPEEYILYKENNDDDVKSIAMQNLESYKFVIDSRGDGNCGYRSFIISACMNNPETMAHHFQTLLDDHFVKLFQIYDQTLEFTYQIFQPIVAEEIKLYLQQILEQVKYSSTIEHTKNIFDQEATFDFYMVMFLRYLLADYIKNLATVDEREFIYYAVAAANVKPMEEHEAIESEIKQILTWKNELDDIETTFLSQATGVTIETVQQNAYLNAITIKNVPFTAGKSSILYTLNPGHYKILVTK